MTRCIHQLIPETCAVCTGLITGRNQTKTYTGAEKDPGIGYRPTVSRQQSYVFEREIEVNEVTRKEEVMDLKEGAEMCPICHVNESPGVRVDNGEPKMCGECRRKAAAEGARKRLEKQALDDKSKEAMSSLAVRHPNPTVVHVLEIMQQRIAHHISEARRLHMMAMQVREIAGVEYEIKALTLVG